MTGFPPGIRQNDGQKIGFVAIKEVRPVERGIINHSQDSVCLLGLFAVFLIIQNDYCVQSFCTVFRQIDG